MSSAASNGPGIKPKRQSSFRVFSYLRGHLRSIAKAAALFVIIFELAGIWNEVHQMRNEQVKNIAYALPKERRNALRTPAAIKRMESTAFVDGNVTIDGPVKLDGPVELDEPVEVEIDR